MNELSRAVLRQALRSPYGQQLAAHVIREYCGDMRVADVMDLMASARLNRAARDAVRELRGTPWLIYGVTTGARGDLAKLLWQPAGASNNVLADRFTYAQQETEELLGFTPDKFVSRSTASFLATAAYYQGRKLAVKRGKNEDNVMGVGMTAAVTTDRERRGGDLVHVAVRTRSGLWCVDVTLRKPEHFATDAEQHRVVQGELADLVALNAILAVAGIDAVPLPTDRVDRSEQIDARGIVRPERVPLWSGPDASRPLYGKVITPDGGVRELDSLSPSEWILFPGSFNPVTYAHDEMAREIERATGKKVIFQITKAHPVKRVTDQDMVGRAGQFRYRWPVVLLEEHGLYVDKAELFPGMEMLIGADVVMERLFDQQFYGGYDQMVAAMERLRKLGAVFHVNGRVCADGHYRELADLPIPPRFLGMFRPFSNRNDVSSSARRAAGATV